MDKINSGQGTVGQLMVNPQLNEALAGTTREFQELTKGLRTEPAEIRQVQDLLGGVDGHAEACPTAP